MVNQLSPVFRSNVPTRCVCQRFPFWNSAAAPRTASTPTKVGESRRWIFLPPFNFQLSTVNFLASHRSVPSGAEGYEN